MGRTAQHVIECNQLAQTIFWESGPDKLEGTFIESVALRLYSSPEFFTAMMRKHRDAYRRDWQEAQRQSIKGAVATLHGK